MLENYPREKTINQINLIRKDPKSPWSFFHKNKEYFFENFKDAKKEVLLKTNNQSNIDLTIAESFFKSSVVESKDQSKLLIKLDHKKGVASFIDIPQYSKNFHDFFKFMDFLSKREVFISISNEKPKIITAKIKTKTNEFVIKKKKKDILKEVCSLLIDLKNQNLIEI